MIYFIVFVIILFVLYLMLQRRSNNIRRYKFYLPKNKRGNMKIELGVNPNPWLRPDSDEISFYNPDYNGRGLIGVVEDSRLYELSSNPNNYLESVISEYRKDYVTIEVEIKRKKEQPKEEIDPEMFARWMVKISKKYKYKTRWDIRFYSAENFTKDEISIKCIDKSVLEQYFNNKKDTFWIEKKNGDKIEASNQTTSPNIIKTLRTLNSNHEIDIINFKQDTWEGNSWYYIEVGVNPE
ncbi:MAG: hypothetical protein ACJATI_003455 [Halioglobus sp.]|jgi:hypothetical protein